MTSLLWFVGVHIVYFFKPQPESRAVGTHGLGSDQFEFTRRKHAHEIRDDIVGDT
jgi:hypothetical protein